MCQIHDLGQRLGTAVSLEQDTRASISPALQKNTLHKNFRLLGWNWYLLDLYNLFKQRCLCQAGGRWVPQQQGWLCIHMAVPWCWWQHQAAAG